MCESCLYRPSSVSWDPPTCQVSPGGPGVDCFSITRTVKRTALLSENASGSLRLLSTERDRLVVLHSPNWAWPLRVQNASTVPGRWRQRPLVSQACKDVELTGYVLSVCSVCDLAVDVPLINTKSNISILDPSTLHKLQNMSRCRDRGVSPASRRQCHTG